MNATNAPTIVRGQETYFTAIVELPHPGRWRVAFRADGVTATPAPRRKVREVAAEPGAVFDFPHHGHWKCSFYGDSYSATPVPRWEVQSIDCEEQPSPVATEWGADKATLTRWWEAEDVPRCELCSTCSAADCPDRPGLKVCTVQVRRAVSEADAPLYGYDTPAVLWCYSTIKPCR